MLRTKQDIDRHVSLILGKIKDEKERSSRGYQIARLYYDIGQYELARRYITTFLSVRETVPQSHKLYGLILVALNEKEKALACYKRSFDLDNSQKDLVLKICELCTQTAMDPERSRFWLEKAEHMFPNSDAVFKLKQVIMELKSDGDTSELENLLTKELVNRPQDVGLRVKLLRMYFNTDRIEDAYNTAVATDKTMAFVNSIEWYETLVDIYQVYKAQKGCRGNIDFYMQYLFTLSRVVYLRMCYKDTVSSANMLHVLDQTLQEAVEMLEQTEELMAFLEEMQGQVFFLAGTLLLKRAQKGQHPWKEVSPLTGMCYMLNETFKTQDPQSWLAVKLSKSPLAKLFDTLQKMSNFRRSQGGHLLKQMSNNVADWQEKTRQEFASRQGQNKLYEMLFTLREQRAKKDNSFLMHSKAFDDSTLCVPLDAQLVRFDKVSCQLHPDNLSDLIWIALHWYTSTSDTAQPSYGFEICKNLQYSTHLMNSGSPESLCQLDMESFLYASVRCAACRQRERHSLSHRFENEPWLLPSSLCKPLCSPEQTHWWEAAYKFSTNTVRENFSRMRHILTRGIETVRLVGNHGLSTDMIVNLARTFDKMATDLKKLESEGRGSADRVEEIEARAAFYWKLVLEQLSRLQKNQTLPVPKIRLFAVDSDRELDCNVPADLKAIEDLKEEARFSVGVVAMNNKEFEEAIKSFKDLTSPWASFYTAKIYKMLAKDEETVGAKESNEKSIALLNMALESLYHTMDLTSNIKNHELNGILDEEVQSLQSELARRSLGEKMNESSLSEYHTPPCSREDPEADLSVMSLPTPSKSSPAVKIQLDTSATRSHLQLSPERSRSYHLQPSPERLDAQLRSLSFSHDTLLKMVLERNEDLAKINKEMVQQLCSSHELIHQLKNELDSTRNSPGHFPYMAGSPYRPQYPYSPQPGWALPYNCQMQSPGNFQSYRTPIPPRQNIRPSFGGHPGYPGKPEDDLGHNEDDDYVPSMEGEYYNVGLDEDSHYYTPEANNMQDWQFGNRACMESSSAMMYSPQNRPQMQQQQQQQNGLIAAHLRGPALQFTGQPSGIPTSMPGPGFFSAPQASAQGSPAGPQTSLMSAVIASQAMQSSYGGIPGSSMVNSQMMSNPNMNTGTSLQQYLQGPQVSPSVFGLQPTQKPFSFGNLSDTAAKVPEAAAVQQKKSLTPDAQDLSLHGSGFSATPKTPVQSHDVADSAVFSEKAKYTNKLGITQTGFVRMYASGDIGYIIMENEGEFVFKFDFSAVKLQPGFSPQPVCLMVMLPDTKIETTINIIFDDSEHASKFREMHKLLSQKVKTLSVTSPPDATPASSIKPVVTTQTTPPSIFSGQTTPGTKESKFGGFTFTSTPIVKPLQEPTSDPKTSPGFKLKESSLKITSPSESTQAKPFSGFSFSTVKSTPSSTPNSGLFAGKGSSATPTFGSFNLGQNTPTSSTPADTQQSAFGFKGFKNTATQPFQSPASPHDEEKVEEYEPNVEFKPVIDLPELVDVKTGEENEKKLFGERSRLFRFDTETGQWKERGIGEMKILESIDGKRFRILMRREQVLKICANHNISTDMKLTPMPSSDRAWCWTAMDFSDEAMKTEQLAVKFKTPDIAANFKEMFENCQKQLADNPVATGADMIPEELGSTEVAQKDKDQQSFADKFKPKAGSWECSGCYCRNDADVFKCPACQTLKPGTLAEDVNQKLQEGGGGFQFGSTTGLAWGSKGGFVFGSDKSQSKESSSTVASKEISLADKFKPKPGSWECNGCYCRNDANVLKCPACQTLKPGVKQDETDTVSSTQKGTISSAGFQIGTSGGFTFGASKPKTEEPKETITSSTDSKEISFADKFRPKPGSWECTGCYCRNDANVLQCPACQTLKPGTKKEDVKPKSQAQPGTISTEGGFKFGSTGGFTFGASKPQAEEHAIDASNKQTVLFDKTNKPAPKTGGFPFGVESNAAEVKPEPLKKGSTLAALLAAEDEPASAMDKFSFAPAPKAVGFNFGEAAKSGGFQFSLGKVSTPAKDQENISSDQKTTPFQFAFSTMGKDKTGDPASPKSPQVDEHGMYINKEGEDSHIYFEPVVPLPAKIEVKTGEEDESVLFEHRAKLYRFDNGEWKERGLGNVKILENRLTNKIRILMRREQVFKLCLNHMISPELQLNPMPKAEGRAWVWYAQDFADEEPKIEQFTIRFKTAEIAETFKTAFDEAKSKMSESPKHAASRQLFASEDETEIEFLLEEKATEAQIARAREFLLPDNFYLYENKPPCPGCVGCEDEDITDVSLKKTRDVEETVVPVFGQALGDKGNKLFSEKLYSQDVEEIIVPVSGQTLGDKGNKLFSEKLDLQDVEETMVPVFGQGLGDKGNKLFSENLDSQDVEESVVPVFGQSLGDKGNKLFSEKLESQDVEETVVPVFGQALGDKGNKLFSEKLDTQDVEETVVPVIGQTLGDKGNKLFSEKLNLQDVEETIVPVFGQTLGDKGNKLFSENLDSQDVEETVVPVSGQTLGDKGNKLFSEKLDSQVSENTLMFEASGFSDFSQLKGVGFKKDHSKPFKWTGAGQQLFGATATPTAGEDEVEVAPYSEDIHFEPIIPLPDLVEIKTGDEGWDVLFSHRSKLYRFHTESRQWKERGIGEMKIMKNNGKFRLLMRREQVLKVVCNHMLTPEINFTPLQSSETAWCWVAQDFSEGEPQIEKLAVKFKTKELFDEFKATIDDCIREINRAGGDNSYGVQDGNNSAVEEKDKPTAEPDSDLVVESPTEKEVKNEEEQKVDDENKEFDEEEEEEEEEEYLFDKRATLSCAEPDGSWKKLGMGSLRVWYNDDVGAYSMEMTSDDDTKLCNHIISREQRISLDEKSRSCLWSPTDFSTDEPVRRHFKATFSSPIATREFFDIYNEGFQMAIKNEISEDTGICNVMEKPVMFSRGDDPSQQPAGQFKPGSQSEMVSGYQAEGSQSEMVSGYQADGSQSEMVSGYESADSQSEAVSDASEREDSQSDDRVQSAETEPTSSVLPVVSCCPELSSALNSILDEDQNK